MQNLITLLLAGEWHEAALISRCLLAIRKRHSSKWVRKFVGNVLLHFPRRPRERLLRDYLQSPVTDKLLRVSSIQVDLSDVDLVPKLAPAQDEFRNWNLPEIGTAGQLASFLRFDIHQLQWLADPYRLEPKRVNEKCRHYRYRWTPRQGRSPRLLEIPKERLKHLQQDLLRGLFSKVPGHDAAHAFTPGRSIRTYVVPHCGKAVVLHLDLKDFFWQITRSRVSEMIRLWGYPERVADLLANLVTNSVADQQIEALSGNVSDAEFDRRRLLLRAPHLPQGAPTSPALSNLIAYTLDARLTGLARAWGGHYTRYADDLLFSGDEKLAAQVSKFLVCANSIILAEGFQIQHAKTKVMPQGRAQQTSGIVLNEVPNLPREEFDTLKAILFNCLRHGPANQNRSGVGNFHAFLLGKIGYWKMIHPGRGAKLQALFDKINWVLEELPANDADERK